MKKGFTLIELLAVLVVLSVISLIATPVVIGVIESSQKNSFKITCNEIYNAYDQYDISEDVGKNNICNIFDFSSDKENIEFLGNTKYVPISKLELKGEVPTSGVYKICSDVRILTISNGKYTCIKDEKDTQILDGGLPDNDITSPIIDDITLTSTTNSIRVIVNAKEEDGIITKYYYKINGEVTTSESNIKTYENLDKNTEYEIEVIVENKSGLKSNPVVKKITTKNINNPEIKQVSQNPVSGYTWATSRTIQITYSNTNINSPVYYFKSSVGATVASGVVTASCGTSTNPGTCTSSNVTTLVANTWYKTNNTSLNVTYQTNGVLYALTGDGVNISGTSTYTVSKVSTGIPTVPVIMGGSTDWTNTSRSISIKTESTEVSGIEKYQYYVSTSPTDQIGGEWLDGTSMVISTSGTRYIYMRAIANNGNMSGVSNYQISKIDKTPPTINAYSGTMLYSDPYFTSGINQTQIYNNTGNTNVTITRKAISGTYYGYGIEIKTVGAASPGHGGFTFKTPSAANKEFITIIKAKIPVGYTIEWASNSIGTGGEYNWLTSQQGTGDWKTYVVRVKCGASGTFSTTNYFYLKGGATATASSPVVWQVQCATTIDTTKYGTSNYIIFTGKDVESGMTGYGINQKSTVEPSMVSENTGWWAGGYTKNETYYIWMKDAAGNVSKVPVLMRYIDRTAPSVTVSVNGKTATFTFSDNVGIAGYGVNTSSTSAPSFTSTTSTSATWTASSAGTYYVWVKDVAGNLNKTSFTIAPICSYNPGQQWTYSYTGGAQSFTVPCSGTYKLEVWGAQGGSHNSNDHTEVGGNGGYSYGNKSLSLGTSLYIYVGGQGAERSTGGYNGGGSCVHTLECAGGGGATHIATSNRGILANYSSYRSEVLIVAGGGGGGGGSLASYGAKGGTGGGTSGGDATATDVWTGALGKGGTQTAGGAGRGVEAYATGEETGSFGTGGKGTQAAGSGGGAGWYGGGAGGNYNGGSPGGGGSGYIGGVTGGSMTNGSRSGNGYARITLVSISN